jgi:hypothetical protein
MSVAASEDDQRSALRRWIVGALGAGEGFAYTEPQGAPTPTSVSRTLAGSGVDIDRAHRDGLLWRVPMADFYAVNAPTMLAARASAQGLRGMRIAVDARQGLQVLDRGAYLEFERQLGDACAMSPLSALCQFHADAAGSWLSEVSSMHMYSSSARWTSVTATR